MKTNQIGADTAPRVTIGRFVAMPGNVQRLDPGGTAVTALKNTDSNTATLTTPATA